MFGLFKKKTCVKKAFYTFCPRFIFTLDPHKGMQRDHWGSQDAGDPHGYDKYEDLNVEHTDTLFREIEKKVKKDETVLDLGCNCGYMLNRLKKNGYGKLAGVDICANAVAYGKQKFDLNGVDMVVGSYEETLPKFAAQGRVFDLVYSGGASISLVHPSFDVVKYICAVSSKYVILVDEDNLGFPYPRLWEYEFNLNGFALVKFLRPSDGSCYDPAKDDVSSFAVYQRIKR